MPYKNPLFKSIWVFAVTAMLLFPSTMRGAEVSGPELLNLLREKDRMSRAIGYKVSFLLKKQAHRFDPNQGIAIQDCQATLTPEGSFAMKKTDYYEKEIPVFGADGTGGYSAWDYDRDGNLIVWREVESYVLFGPERNDRIQHTKALRIDPNGKLVREGSIKRTLHRYPIGRGNTYEFDELQLAAGRGFSRDLGGITSAKTLPSGLLQATGHRPGRPGHIWKLTIDPNSDYLVRKAILTPEGENKPTIVVTSGGIMMKDGIKTGKYGTYRYSSSPERSFEVTDISKVVGPNKLYEEVLLHLDSPLPPGSMIIDLRGEKPIRTTVEN